MIVEITKDITTVKEGVIFHGCNCQGVMGSGVAGALRNKWPQIFDAYINSSLILGDISVANVQDDVYVINGLTQEYYGNDGKVYASGAAIEIAIAKSVIYCITRLGLYHMYLPPVGCGLGGLDKTNDLMPILESFDFLFYLCDK